MSNIVRDSDVVEISEPPVFSFGEKVKSRRTIRNDGTYAGKEIGDVLAKKGEEGYIVSIGTFLQQFYLWRRISRERKPRRDEAQRTRCGAVA